MIFDYPYTDMHELNLDWFLAKFKELVEEWNQVQGEWTSLHDYVQNYFDNLNVQTEIDNKINAMILDGSFATIVTPLVEAALPTIVDGKLPAVVAAQISAVVADQISAVVADQLPAVAAAAAAQEVGTWLAAHIDPDTGYVIDNTLTVNNAAANAKTVGDTAMLYRGDLQDLSITDLKTCINPGWYGSGAVYAANITDKPIGFDSAIDLVVRTKAFRSITNFVIQDISDTKGNVWRRILQKTGSGYIVYVNWILISDERNYILRKKKVAILGDSISTNGSDGDCPNVPEITIEAADVGVELHAYLTYYDVQGGLTLGGHTFTSSEIGNDVTFTPTNDDIGKQIGVSNNYNNPSTVVWWEVLRDFYDFTPIPVCWSGASITSHESSANQYKTSHAWHDAQIRKCGIRTPGTVNRTGPDLVIIYRGTNDFSHSPYSKLTQGYFDNYNWQYPVDDTVEGGYGYKEGYSITIQKLHNRYPNAKIFLATLNVFKRVNYSHYPTNNGEVSLPQYNDAIREIADFFGCGLIEFDKDGITFENCYTQGYITDSSVTPTHPSNKGHKAMGMRAMVDINAQYSPLT